mmetsp:Transcript_5827/g.24526  ORF Transcript_5827/g.24526 Transcript_5827/m.24526 type:complete len:239 (+) Transcript_5827:489-1205(+)
MTRRPRARTRTRTRAARLLPLGTRPWSGLTGAQWWPLTGSGAAMRTPTPRRTTTRTRRPRRAASPCLAPSLLAGTLDGSASRCRWPAAVAWPRPATPCCCRAAAQTPASASPSRRRAPSAASAPCGWWQPAARWAGQRTPLPSCPARARPRRGWRPSAAPRWSCSAPLRARRWLPWQTRPGPASRPSATARPPGPPRWDCRPATQALRWPCRSAPQSSMAPPGRTTRCERRAPPDCAP